MVDPTKPPILKVDEIDGLIKYWRAQWEEHREGDGIIAARAAHYVDAYQTVRVIHGVRLLPGYENDPAGPPPAQPRGPFNRITPNTGLFSRLPKCQICKRKYRARPVGAFDTFRIDRLTILAVGPFAICEECVKVLDEALRA